MRMETQHADNEISYHKNAFETMGLEYRTNPWDEKKILRVLKFLGVFEINAHRVLDYGCGTAAFTPYLKKSFDSVIGLDITYSNIKIAKNIDKNCEYICGDGINLPFRDESMDAVFCGAILHHFPDVTEPIKEINRVLKQNGILFAVEGNEWNPLAFVQYRTRFGKGWKTKGHRPLNYLYVKRRFSQCGFTVRKINGISFAPSNAKGIWKLIKKMEPFLESIPLVNLLGGSLLVTAEKVDQV
jgi:ubiquinone/menaquinone biosynthesis C-methylase UbiE